MLKKFFFFFDKPVVIWPITNGKSEVSVRGDFHLPDGRWEGLYL
jgi:hypothetical protein